MTKLYIWIISGHVVVVTASASTTSVELALLLCKVYYAGGEIEGEAHVHLRQRAYDRGMVGFHGHAGVQTQLP